MNDQKMIVASLAMDLKRVALGLHRGSLNMANRFKEEVLKRARELESQQTSNYLRKLLVGMKSSLAKNNERTAEDALMYSILLQNYVTKK